MLATVLGYTFTTLFTDSVYLIFKAIQIYSTPFLAVTVLGT
mgnify:FL=1